MRAFLTNEAEISRTLITVDVFQSVIRKFETKFVAIRPGTIFAILSNAYERLTLEVVILW